LTVGYMYEVISIGRYATELAIEPVETNHEEETASHISKLYLSHEICSSVG